MDVFDRYAPFVQDFIYAHGWEQLRGVQVAAADAIFNTDDNVLSNQARRLVQSVTPLGQPVCWQWPDGSGEERLPAARRKGGWGLGEPCINENSLPQGCRKKACNFQKSMLYYNCMRTRCAKS